MKVRIGYLIPEFPGQTHIFFWRERQVLTELGIEANIVSTRKASQASTAHEWAAEAQKNTTYLLTFTPQDVMGAFVQILRAGPTAWFRCLTVILKAKDTSFVQKIRLLTMIFVAGKLAQLARTNGWFHVHVHSCADAANVTMFASILSDLSYSLTLHGPTLELYGPNQEQKWQRAAFALVVSEKLLNDVKNKLGNFLPKQIAVAPMGVNLSEIQRRGPYVPCQVDSPCRIFTCGRLNPIKGHNYLIDTIELMRKRGFDVRLQIAGEDEQGGNGYRKVLEKIVRDKSMSKYIELLGSISEAQIRDGLENAHVFALASLNEGISVAVMEAMAMEIPVVVTNVGGMSELIDNSVDAMLVPPEKPEEMADAIAKVLQDKALALSLSQESRKKITAKFHHRRSAETLARCLVELSQKEFEKCRA